MNRGKFSSLFLTGLIALCSLSVQSQQTSFSNEGQSAELRAREKAFDLLEAVAGEIGSLQSPENRPKRCFEAAGLSIWNCSNVGFRP
jgi:hypothetical protein